MMRQVGRGRPELQELLSDLQAVGVEDGGAVHVVEAMARGGEHFARVLAADGNAWRRFKEAFDALRSGAGYVSPDPVTIGSLVWITLEGERFTDAVTDALVRRERLN